ncbi:hypothetical protein LG047_08910 [Methylocystis sp. WRRC1]|uniref:hypothetical protein n=1 Tax=Methylocystis sp. WRRC1 TaxID=1732014 RepID=UPI001D1457E6|nr:hypothetical protein [Methylocystis sp. WRRC1]MCC3245439.1 hypothetical protein [Methylocystis sp. WRRC1]
MTVMASKPKTVAVAPRNDSREQLAQAITAHRQAEADLDAASRAEQRAQEGLFEARDRLAAIRAQLAAPLDAAACVAAFADGGDVAALVRPAEDLRARADSVEREIEALKAARERLEFAQSERRAAVSSTRSSIAVAARAVVMSETPVAAMLHQLEEAQRAVAERRIALWSLHSLLPTDSAERAAIEKLLAAPWLSDEPNWNGHSAGAAYRAAFERLTHDADAAWPTPV